jgi:hypothetical protein
MDNICFHTKVKKYFFLNLMPKGGQIYFAPLPIWTMVCFETIVTFLFIAAQF